MSISKTYSNLLWMEHKPFSSVGCEDDSTSCLKRKLQEQYTRGSFLILQDVSAETHLEAISSKWSIFLFFFFSSFCIFFFSVRRLYGFMNSRRRRRTVNTQAQMQTCNINVREGILLPSSPPVALTFTLVAKPKLNLNLNLYIVWTKFSFWACWSPRA